MGRSLTAQIANILRRCLVVVLPLMVSSLLLACSFVPREGPLAIEIERQSVDNDYVVVNVDSQIVDTLGAWHPVGLHNRFMRRSSCGANVDGWGGRFSDGDDLGSGRRRPVLKHPQSKKRDISPGRGCTKWHDFAAVRGNDQGRRRRYPGHPAEDSKAARRAGDPTASAREHGGRTSTTRWC